MGDFSAEFGCDGCKEAFGVVAESQFGDAEDVLDTADDLGLSFSYSSDTGNGTHFGRRCNFDACAFASQLQELRKTIADLSLDVLIVEK